MYLEVFKVKLLNVILVYMILLYCYSLLFYSFCHFLSTNCLCIFPLFPLNTDNVEAELLHTFTKVYKFDTMLLLVRLAVLTAVTLTVPIVLFPVSTSYIITQSMCCLSKSLKYFGQLESTLSNS